MKRGGEKDPRTHRLGRKGVADCVIRSQVCVCVCGEDDEGGDIQGGEGGVTSVYTLHFSCTF